MNKTLEPKKSPKRARRSNELRRAETRSALLSAAIDVFSDVGFAAGTTKIIADRANVTRGALQYHFDSKEDMIIAVMDHAMDRINFGFNVQAHLDKPISERVDVILTAYREAFASPTFLAAIQIFLGVRKEPQLSRRMIERLAESREAINKTWLTLFPEAADKPETLNVLRRLTMGVIRGYVVIEALGATDFWKKDQEMMRQILEEQIGRLVKQD